MTSSTINDQLATVVTEFNQVFRFTPGGQLCTGNVNLARVEAFIAKNRLLMAMATGIDVPVVHFAQDDFLFGRSNRALLLHVYSISYAAYRRINETLERTTQ